MRDLATASKVSASTVSRFENGSPDVYLSHVRALFDALGMQFYVSDIGAAAHYVVVAREKDSKTWNGLGHAHTRPDGSVDVFVPLLNRHLFLRPVASAAEAKAWPVTADERDVWPTRETVLPKEAK